MLGAGEASVRRPPIALDHPGEPLAEDLGGLLIAAAGGDQVHGHGAIADEHPQPLPMPGDPPAGLIRGERRATAHRDRERLIGRLGRVREPADRVIQATRRDRDPEHRQDL